MLCVLRCILTGILKFHHAITRAVKKILPKIGTLFLYFSLKALPLAVLLMSSSCYHSTSQFQTESKFQDESTEEEREKIKTTLQMIHELALESGYEKDFSAVPVYVSSENINVSQRLGYCVWDRDRNGTYIVLNRENFTSEKERPRFKQVFAVLVHEIGHCYFKRDHNSDLLTKTGYALNVLVEDDEGGTKFIEPGFPLSAMYTFKQPNCTAPCQEFSSRMPEVEAFQRYYVHELVSDVRILSAADVEKLGSAKWEKWTGAEENSKALQLLRTSID